MIRQQARSAIEKALTEDQTLRDLAASLRAAKDKQIEQARQSLHSYLAEAGMYDPTVYARVDYLDTKARLSDAQRAACKAIGDPNHRYIPHLWTDIVPKGVLFTNMRVEHKVVHPNSTGSMVTGHWEWDDLDWTRPVAPTVLEYLDLGAASGMVSSVLNRVR